MARSYADIKTLKVFTCMKPIKFFNNACTVQSVENQTANPKVVGSSPALDNNFLMPSA